MNFPTLYRRSLDGIEIWNIETLGNKIIATWGKLKGKQTVRETEVLSGKNIGKSNETTSSLQAELEAKSKWEKKVKREGYYSLEMLGYEAETLYDSNDAYTGYYLPIKRNINLSARHLTLAEVLLMLPLIGDTNEGGTLPMLAKSFYLEKKGLQVPRLSFPMLVQPKLNGVRALMKILNGRVRFWSRTGVEYIMTELSSKIEAKLAQVDNHSEFYLDLNDCILDGELYIHNTILADIVSAVKKPNLNTSRVEFWSYDIANDEKDQAARLRSLKIIGTYLTNGVKIVPTKVAKDIKTVETFCDEYIVQGYEGLIARNPIAYYQFGARTADLLKLKRRQSGEFKIVDVYDTAKQPGLAMFKCLNDLNREYFEVVPEGSHAQRRQYLDERTQIIGKLLTVEYYERTDKPKEVPFHAVGIAIRDYE